MKHLTLVRHGDAAQPLGVADFDRPLSAQGEKEVANTARILAARQPQAVAIHSSAAKRALETASALVAAYPRGRLELVSQHQLYSFDCAPLYRFIEFLDESLTSLVLVGHNPALSLLAFELGAKEVHHMATASMVSLALDIDSWVEVVPGCGRLLWYHDPANPALADKR